MCHRGNLQQNTNANLSGARLEGTSFLKTALDGADLAGAYLDGAQFLKRAQLIIARNWESASVMRRLPAAQPFPTGYLQRRRNPAPEGPKDEGNSWRTST